ncbi:MAG: putative metal-binding membrane protein [Gammaproteobacteria bacterium]
MKSVVLACGYQCSVKATTDTLRRSPGAPNESWSQLIKALTMNPSFPTLMPLLRRERAIVIGALLVITALSWWYLSTMSMSMPPSSMSSPLAATETVVSGSTPSAHTASELVTHDASKNSTAGQPLTPSALARPGMRVAQLGAWTSTEAVLMFVMWSVMMVGMMLPSAAPMILMFARVSLNHRRAGRPYVATSVFVLGYVLAWGLFSAAATAAQWGLERVALMGFDMRTTDMPLAGALFIAAGLYQLSPLKHACLRLCRSPLDFVLNRWREGSMGALRMGTAHGLYCLGCCWLLMLLLFVGGVMNLLWIATLSAFVLIEKLLPAGTVTSRITGVAMAAFGCYLIGVN